MRILLMLYILLNLSTKKARNAILAEGTTLTKGNVLQKESNAEAMVNKDILRSFVEVKETKQIAETKVADHIESTN
eukprot:gene14496-biopygen4273